MPFATVLAVAFFGGLWMVLSSLHEGIYDPGFMGIAAVLIGACGYIEYRVLRSVRSLLTDRKLLPMNRALQTKL